MRFEGLSPTQFEEFCFDLMSECGFVNVDWRKGTPTDASPADGGRDIVAEIDREDVDGHRYRATWFVDGKQYRIGELLESRKGLDLSVSRSESARAPNQDLGDASTSQTRCGALGPRIPARRPYETLRRVRDILSAEAELSDRLWYGRKPHDDRVPEDWNPEIVEGVLAAKRRVEEQYGQELLEGDVKDEWSWGYLSEKVAAIRWVLGYEWDMLDS